MKLQTYYEECEECMTIIRGRTQHHAKENLKLHKKSSHHKKQIEMRAILKAEGEKK